MAEITIDSRGPHEFQVPVRERGYETTHIAVVPEDFCAEYGLPPVALVTLVERSFEFLLEREPASSVLPRFTLGQIGRYFPEYQGEIAHRLSAD